MKTFDFNQDYYKRWYENDETRTFMKEETPGIVNFVLAYIVYLELDVKSVLDVGCGLGYWRNELAATGKGIEYTGLDISDYLCDRYGWQKGSIADYQPGRQFDLVVCQSVLQYLNQRDCARAIGNLGALCAEALYVEVPTKRDLEEVCLPQRTDMSVHRRTGRWYRKRLQKDFVNMGGGFFVKRAGEAPFYELWTPA